MKCLVQQMKQIAATNHSNGLWFGRPHLGEQLLTAISGAKCSHSPHGIIHQPRKTLGRENMLPPKMCMTDSSKAWLEFIGALQINKLHLHFWRGRLHIHIKRRNEELEIVLVFDSPEQSFSSSLPVSSLPWLPRKWQAQSNWSKWLAAANQCCLSTPKNELQAMRTYWLLLREL